MFGKLNNPFAWVLGLMTGGIIMVGATTYMIVEAPTKTEEYTELTVTVQRQTPESGN